MNWKTSLFGTIAAICAVITAAPDLVGNIFDGPIAHKVVAICALLSAITAAFQAKDKDVTGDGSTFSPHRRAR